jgi:hypothetical protein
MFILSLFEIVPPILIEIVCKVAFVQPGLNTGFCPPHKTLIVLLSFLSHNIWRNFYTPGKRFGTARRIQDKKSFKPHDAHRPGAEILAPGKLDVSVQNLSETTVQPCY